MTKHVTHIDGSRLDVEKKSHPATRWDLNVQMVNEAGDGAAEVTYDLGVINPRDERIESTRDITVSLVAEAVAAVLDRHDIATGHLIRAKVSKKKTVRDAYGPSRDYFDWIDADPDEFDRAVKERSETYREANGQ